MISWQTHSFKPWLRTVALLTVCVFTFTSVVWDGGAKAYALPAGRPNPASLTPVENFNANAALSLIDRPDLPDSYGTIKSSFKGNREQIILAIQDAHINEEAQRNIANILRHFSEKYQLGLVNLEGASGELYTELFSFFPNKEARRNVADYFLKEGRLTGPEYLAIVEKPVMTLYGVEDPELYEENRKAYVDALQFKGRDEEVLAALNKVLEYMSRFVFPEEMRELFRRRAAFQESGRELVAYVRFLVDMAQKHSLKPENYEGMQSLIQLVDLEKQINFAKAEKETDALINDLKRMLSREKLSRFLINTVHFRMKQMKRAAYYGYLQDEIRGMSVAQTGGEDLTKKYANVLAYIQYMMLYDSIGVSLFDEIEVLEKDVKNKLFTTPEEIKLDHLLRIYDVMNKMFDFTLTKQDAEFYYTHQDEFKAETFSSFLKPLTQQYHFSLGLPSQMEILDQDLPRVERFYKAALERDQVLVERAVEKTLATGQKISAIVTGGFHTPGIEKYLQEKGLSYIVIAPRISKAIDKKKESALYDAALREAPLPIEKVLSEAFLAPKTGVLNDPRFQLSAEHMIVREDQEPSSVAKSELRLTAISSMFNSTLPSAANEMAGVADRLNDGPGKRFVKQVIAKLAGSVRSELRNNPALLFPAKQEDRVGAIMKVAGSAKRSEVRSAGIQETESISLPDGTYIFGKIDLDRVVLPSNALDALATRRAEVRADMGSGLFAEMGTMGARAEVRAPAATEVNADEQARYKENLDLFHAAGFADPKKPENIDKQKAAEQAFRRLLLNTNFPAKLDALQKVGTQDLSNSVILRLLSRSSPEAIKTKIPALREAISLEANLKITTDTVSLTMDAINGVIAERKTALAGEAEAAAVAEREAAPKREAEVAVQAAAPKVAEVTPAKPIVASEAKPAEETVPVAQEKQGIFKKARIFWGRLMDKVNNGTSVALTPFVKVRVTLYRYTQGYRFQSAEGLSGISSFTRFSSKKDKDLFIHQIRARTLGRTGYSKNEEELLSKIPSLRVEGKTPVRLEDLNLAQLEEVERAIRDLQVEKDFEQRQHMKEQRTLDLSVKSHKGIFYVTGVVIGLLTGAGVAALISLAWPVLAIGTVIGLMMTREMANVTFVFIENVKTLFKSGSVAKGLLGVLFVLGAPLYLSIQLMSSFIQKLIYPIMYRIHGTGQRTYFVKIGKDGKVEIDPETEEAIVDVKALTDALNRRLSLVVGQTIEDYLAEKKDAALTALAEKAKELSRQAATTTGDWDQVNKELDQALTALPAAEAQQIRTLFDQHIVVQKRLQNVANHLARSDALHARIIRVLHLQDFLAKKITDFLGSKSTSAKAVRYIFSDITNPLGAFFQWFVFGRGALFFKGIIAGAFILTGPIGTGIALALFVSYRAYGVYQIRKEKFRETLAAIEGKYEALPKTELNETQKVAEIKKATRSYRVKTAGSVFGMAAGLGIAGYLLIGAFVAPDLISFIPHNLFSKQVVLKVFGDAVPLSLGTILKDVFLGMIMAYGGAAKKSRAEHVQEKYFLEPVLKLMRSYGFKTMEASGFFAFSRTEGGKTVSTLTYEGVGQYFDAIGPEQRQDMAKRLGMDPKTFEMFLLSHLEMLRGMIVANVLGLNQNEQLLLLERINGIQAELAGRYTQDEIQKAHETGRVLTSSAVDHAVATRMEINRMARYRTLGGGRFYLSGFTTAMGLITLAFEIPAVLHLFGSLDSVANQALKPLGIAEFHGFHTVAMFIERTLLGLFNNVWQGMWSLGGLVPLVAPEAFLNSALARIGIDIADRQVSHDIATLQARMTGMREGTETYRTEAGHLAELQAEKVRMTASPALARLDGELRKLPKSSVTALLARQLFSKVTSAVLDPNHAMSLEEMKIAIASVETVIRQARAEASQAPVATGEPIKVMQAGMVPNPLPLIEKVFSGMQSLFAPKTMATPQQHVQEKPVAPPAPLAAVPSQEKVTEAPRTELVTEQQAAPAELQKLSADLRQAVEEGKAALAKEGKTPTPYNIGSWLKANEAKYPKVVEKFQTEVMENPDLAAVMTGAAVPEKFTEQLKGRSLRALTRPVDDIFGPNTSAVLSLVSSVAVSGPAAVGEKAVQTAQPAENAAAVAARPAPKTTGTATARAAAISGPMGAAAEEARRTYEKVVSKRAEAEYRLGESRARYAEQISSYFADEVADRIQFGRDIDGIDRVTAESLRGRTGFIASLSARYAEALKIEALREALENEAQKGTSAQTDISKLIEALKMDPLKEAVLQGDVSKLIEELKSAANQGKISNPQDISKLIEVLKNAVARADVSKLSQEKMSEVLTQQLDAEGLKSISGGVLLSATEIAVLKSVFEAGIRQRFEKPGAKEQAAATREALSDAFVEARLDSKGTPISFEELWIKAVIERLKTGRASQVVVEAMANARAKERGLKLSVVARAGTDFAFKGVGVGLDFSIFISDPSGNEREAFAQHLSREGQLLVDQAIADVNRELLTHMNNFARARILEKAIRDFRDSLKPDLELARKRTAEGMDTDAASALEALYHKLGRDLSDRVKEEEGILRSVGTLIGVGPGVPIRLSPELEDPSLISDPVSREKLRTEAAQHLEQYGLKLGEAGNLDLAQAQGKYSLAMIETSYKEALGKMGILFNARIFYNFGGVFDFRSPLTFEHDSKTHPMIYRIARDRAAMQYFRDAQAIEANRQQLSARAKTAQETAVIAEARFANAQKILDSERELFRSGGWSHRFKAAAEEFELRKNQMESAHNAQAQLQIEIDRFAVSVSSTLARFDQDFERDAAKVREGESQKFFNTDYFQHLKERFDQSPVTVDATTLESSLRSGNNMNLRGEELRQWEIDERQIQTMDAAGVKFGGTFVDAQGRTIQVNDLQSYEAKLFSEYERATTPKERDLIQKIRGLFQAEPREPNVIMSEIESVNKAKRQAFEKMLPEIMRGVWLRQAGYDEERPDGTIVHHVGELEDRMREAQEILASAQATLEEKEKASRDVAALGFAFEQVNTDLKNLGEGKAEKVFSSSFLESGGLIGIGIIGGGKGVGLFGSGKVNVVYDGQIDALFQLRERSKMLQAAHARDFVRNVLVERQFLDQINLRVETYGRAIQDLNDSRQKVLVIGSGTGPLNELVIRVTSETEGVSYEGVDQNGRTLSVRVQKAEGDKRIVEITDANGEKIFTGDPNLPQSIQAELFKG
ncbi:MAG: hypothetical protein V1673_05195, partial [Candidatus Omnitrophota bacterium]